MKHKALFNKMQDSVVLEKSRTYARWTIAYLMTDANKDGKSKDVEGDFQSRGAMLVNSLASKLATLLFPNTTPFMRINLDDVSLALLEESGVDTAEVNSLLARMEMEASQRVFRNDSFNQLVTTIKQLAVTGNACIHRNSAESRIRSYGLNDYVVKRDSSGVVVDAIVRDRTYYESLPYEVQESLKASGGGNQYKGTGAYEKPIYIYTRMTRINTAAGAQYTVTQQVEDTELPDDMAGAYPANLLPWVFPAWNLISGENYGRGLVEEHKGDFAKMSEVSEALTLYMVESMRILNLYGASSASNIDDLQNSETGSWVRADPEAVKAFESGSSNKIQLISGELEQLFQNLARAFMYKGNTRSGERVTAYEIRQDAIEIEEGMGGAFSALAESLQLPLSYLLLNEVDPQFVSDLSQEGKSRLDINTGINALGRASKVQNLLQALQEGQVAVELSNVVDRRIDTSKVMDMIFAGRSVDTAEFYKSEEQLRQEVEAEQQQAEAMAQMQAANDEMNQQQVIEGM